MPATRLIRPPEPIGDKVPRSGGPSPEEAILKALDAAAPLIEGYQGWAVDDLEALWQEFRRASQATRPAREQMGRLFTIAHEIRGQGGTFGFPLLTAVADSLCKMLDGKTQLTPALLDAIRIHIFAMKAVFRQGLKGNDPALAREIPRLFRLLREKADSGRSNGAR
jgi:chemotaxis protein histidine kinase CheA